MSKPVVLLWGESEFLMRLETADLLGDTRPVEVAGGEWPPGATGDLATPSLFGEPRALLVTGAEALAREAIDEIAAYAAAPSPDARLVVAAVVSARAKGPPASLNKALKDHADVRRVAVDRKELPSWVQRRAKAAGAPATPAGASALIATLGEDPAALDQAVRQVADVFPTDGLTPETVRSQFRGFGDRRIWELCDAAFAGDAAGALRALTGMLEAREEPLAILGGVGSRLRDLIRVRALPERMPQAQAAREAGLRFDWQVRRYREQARRYSPERLALLHSRLVEADGQLKVGASGEVVLPMVVAAIARA